MCTQSRGSATPRKFSWIQDIRVRAKLPQETTNPRHPLSKREPRRRCSSLGLKDLLIHDLPFICTQALPELFQKCPCIFAAGLNQSNLLQALQTDQSKSSMLCSRLAPTSAQPRRPACPCSPFNCTKAMNVMPLFSLPSLLAQHCQ